MDKFEWLERKSEGKFSSVFILYWLVQLDLVYSDLKIGRK